MAIINLSDAEWKLMNRLWQSSPCTITGLVADFKDDTGWSKHTIISMLSRLEAKGTVRYNEGKRAKQFYPIINREDAQIEETKNFLSRLYGGSVGLMLNTLVNENSLSKEEINELYEILKKAGDK